MSSQRTHPWTLDVIFERERKELIPRPSAASHGLVSLPEIAESLSPDPYCRRAGPGLRSTAGVKILTAAGGTARALAGNLTSSTFVKHAKQKRRLRTDQPWLRVSILRSEVPSSK